jgi:hypothetical protein
MIIKYIFLNLAKSSACSAISNIFVSIAVGHIVYK